MKAEAEAKLAEATKAAAKSLEDAKAEAAAKSEAAEKVLADARLEAVAAKTEAKKRAYAELNTRIALLENRKRSRTITEEEFKEQLAKLRQELGQ